MRHKLLQKTASQVLQEDGEYLVYVAAGLATHNKVAGALRDAGTQFIRKNLGIYPKEVREYNDLRKQYMALRKMEYDLDQSQIDEILSERNLGKNTIFGDVDTYGKRYAESGLRDEAMAIGKHFAGQDLSDLGNSFIPSAPLHNAVGVGLPYDLIRSQANIAAARGNARTAMGGADLPDSSEIGIGVPIGRAVGTSLVAAPLAASGAAIYGLSDADTPDNHLKGLSNNVLGTDLETQSRLGRLFGG